MAEQADFLVDIDESHRPVFPNPQSRGEQFRSFEGGETGDSLVSSIAEDVFFDVALWSAGVAHGLAEGFASCFSRLASDTDRAARGRTRRSIVRRSGQLAALL